MGAASALVAALQQPERFGGLVLYRLPLLWEDRSARKATLMHAADALPETYQGHRSLLKGAANTNLPPATDACWARLKAANLPILILCHGNDAVHPVRSGEALQHLLPHATLKVEADEENAAKAFPATLAAWLRDACGIR